MRIAVSGTHCIGKTTLINDFINSHPEYHSEIEPYYTLQEEQGITFSEDPSLDCMLTQLDYSLLRLEALSTQKNFILDRCPVDFIAYALAILENEDANISDSIISDKFDEVKNTLRNLDLIVFLPITKDVPIIHMDDDEIAFRKNVDKAFKKIYRDEILDIFPGYQQPKIVEIEGSRQTRMNILESYL